MYQTASTANVIGCVKSSSQNQTYAWRRRAVQGSGR